MAEPDSPLHRRLHSLRTGRAARTAIAGAALGWLLIQVASTVLVPLGLQTWAFKLIIAVVVVGWFVAVAVAWGVDFGKRRIARAGDGETAAATAPTTIPQSSLPGMAAGPSLATDPSVAVLAFADMSPVKDQDYFCEGTAEEIINALAGVRGLRVASRSASFPFRNRSVDVREIARLLNVRAVLDGSVRKSGDRVRVVAQLVNAADGALLWSETFDRRLEDIFAIQEEIARSTVGALRVTLLDADAARLHRHGTGNLAAYEFYLRGRQLMAREKEAEQRAAAQLFREAIRLDPQFALAHAGLASVLAHMAARRSDRLPAVSDARQAADRALELSPALAEAHVAHGQVLHLDRRPQEAVAAFERAIALDPRLFDAHYYYARCLVAQGEHAGAVRHYEAAYALRPDDYRPVTLAIQEYQALRDRDGEQDAIRRSWAAIERRLAIDPDDSAAYDHGAGVLTLLGRPEESRRFTERAVALRPDDPLTLYNAACAAALAGDHEGALDHLQRSIELGRGNPEWIMNDNDLVPLHEHPRFKQMMAKLAETEAGA